MVDAFTETEVPLKNIDRRRKFMNYVTHSPAALLVSETITQVLDPLSESDMMEDFAKLS